MDTLLPVLKHRVEFETQVKRNMFTDEVFINMDDSNNPISPFVMYGVDNGASIAYSPTEGAESDLEKKQQALENLAALEVPYSIQIVDGMKLTIIEHEYAAEKILDSEFLKNLARELDSEIIAVGLPMKGVMFAAPQALDGKIYGAIGNAYENNQTYRISKAVFMIKDGDFIAMGGG